MGDFMVDEVRREPEPVSKDGLSAGWRAVIAAWVLVALLVVVSAGAEALASRHRATPQKADIAGVVIPRHDPACAEIPTGACPGFALTLGQLERNGYPLW
jgi:hypothetical protein